MTIVGPAEVIIAHLLYPMRFPDGLTLYKIATPAERYFAIQAPLLRDAEGQPMTLGDEELWAGSLVKLALNQQGLIHAVQILKRCYADPFSAAATAGGQDS